MAVSRTLSAPQRWMMAVTRRHGSGRVVASVTMASVLVSAGVTYAAGLASGDTGVGIGLFLSASIPMVLASTGAALVVGPLAALAHAYDELEIVATTDALTGLANRRRFFAAAEKLLRETQTGAHFAVGMVDVDDFKLLNDSEGHAVGDEALVAVARRLRASLGSQAILGRIGGDEFALLVPVSAGDDPAPEAMIAELGVACGRVQVRPGVAVSASVGVRVLGAPVGIDEALHLADEALYAAKAARPGQRARPVPRSA